LTCANLEPRVSKKDIPLFRIPEQCVGPMTSSPGNIADRQTSHDKRGTAHVHIKTIAPWERKA
jgi:hypothetical protein